MKYYIIKAVREAKVHTAWLKPDTDYEEASISFIGQILRTAEENQFLKEFLAFQKTVAYYGVFNSLSQTLLKMTSPGVPDFYQSTELWDLNLVDPDNRRAVNFEKRELFLNYIREKSNTDNLNLIAELLSTKEDGRIKLFLIYKTLQVRKQNEKVFQKGVYIPIKVEGRFKDHVIAFARNYGSAWVIAIATRFLTSLVNEGELPIGHKVWDDTRLVIEKAPAQWKESFSEQIIRGGETLLIAEVLKHFPAALLVSQE